MDKDDLIALVNKQTSTIDELRWALYAKDTRIEELEAENEELKLEILALKASNASLVGTLEEVTEKQRGHVAQLKEFKAQLEALGAETRHQIELREDGFTIQHPLSCRPNLFNCPLNQAARAEGEDLAYHLEPGRYYCSLAGVDNLIIEERVPDA